MRYARAHKLQWSDSTVHSSTVITVIKQRRHALSTDAAFAVELAFQTRCYNVKSFVDVM